MLLVIKLIIEKLVITLSLSPTNGEREGPLSIKTYILFPPVISNMFEDASSSTLLITGKNPTNCNLIVSSVY